MLATYLFCFTCRLGQYRHSSAYSPCPSLRSDTPAPSSIPSTNALHFLDLLPLEDLQTFEQDVAQPRWHCHLPVSHLLLDLLFCPGRQNWAPSASSRHRTTMACHSSPITRIFPQRIHRAGHDDLFGAPPPYISSEVRKSSVHNCGYALLTYAPGKDEEIG